jgi:predicted hotdog family 3-hydroxylacyl-ACP dehydratase
MTPTGQATRQAQHSAAQVLPHAKPMLLIDEIVECRHEKIVARVLVRADAPFCELPAGMPAWVGVEYMAQTVAAYSGVEELQMHRKASIGLLLGSRRYEALVAHFPVGASLDVEATLLHRDENNLVAFECEILHQGRRLAHGDIKAYRPDNIHDLLKVSRRV